MRPEVLDHCRRVLNVEVLGRADELSPLALEVLAVACALLAEVDRLHRNTVGTNPPSHDDYPHPAFTDGGLR